MVGKFGQWCQYTHLSCSKLRAGEIINEEREHPSNYSSGEFSERKHRSEERLAESRSQINAALSRLLQKIYSLQVEYGYEPPSEYTDRFYQLVQDMFVDVLHVENQEQGQQVIQLPDDLDATCNDLIQLGRTGVRPGTGAGPMGEEVEPHSESDVRPKVKPRIPSPEIQQAKEQWDATKAIDVVVEQDGVESKQDVYIAPRHREAEGTVQSPALEAFAAAKVLPVFEAVTQKLHEEYKVVADQVSRQRAAEKRYREKRKDEDPEAWRKREADRKARWRAEKQKEAKSQQLPEVKDIPS